VEGTVDMKLAYATRLSIYAIENDEEANIYADVIRHSVDWLSYAVKKYGDKIEFDENQKPHIKNESGGAPRCNIEIEHLIFEKREACHMKVNHPDQYSDDLYWEIDIGLRNTDDHVEFTLLIFLRAYGELIKPTYYMLGRPRLVKTLADTYECVSGDWIVFSEPGQYNSDNMDKLVDFLTSDKRNIPLVVVSRNYLEETLVVLIK
jgi:hypothetical protein